MKGRCLVDGEVPGSLIKRCQEFDEVLQKVRINVVEEAELSSLEKDLV